MSKRNQQYTKFKSLYLLFINEIRPRRIHFWSKMAQYGERAVASNSYGRVEPQGRCKCTYWRIGTENDPNASLK